MKGHHRYQLRIDSRAGTAQNLPPPHQPREAKAFYVASHVTLKAFYVDADNYMAKWEIRFQRFALSFRPSALGHRCFRFPLAFSLQNFAFARGANEKFHLYPTCRCNDLGEEIKYKFYV
jgi:hypothetical protein